MLEIGGETIVLTHDMIVEGVHFLLDDPPGDVAWKLVAVNLSDLAAKGAEPIGALLGYSLGDEAWNAAFVEGLASALRGFALPLLGGDTVAAPAGVPRSFGLTALGRASGPVLSRSGAAAGDHLWVTGTIGDAGLGLAVARGEIDGNEAMLHRYRRPQPRLAAGRALAPLASAMMDVSDGLLIDAARMADASGLSASIALDSVPLSPACTDALRAATAGDDYELLFAASPGRAPEIAAIAADLALPVTRIGAFAEGSGLGLTQRGEPVPLPPRLGYEHRPEKI